MPRRWRASGRCEGWRGRECGDGRGTRRRELGRPAGEMRMAERVLDEPHGAGDERYAIKRHMHTFGALGGGIYMARN